MGFHEAAIYPINLSYGSTFGPGFNSAIIEGQGGRAQRVPRLEQPLYGGDLATGIRSLTEMATFRTFYIARQGAAYGFRFSDPLDNTSAADGVSAAARSDQYLGTGDGINKIFQLRKQYIDSGITRNRTIEKPVTPSVLIEVNGLLISDSLYTVDYTTGIVTFTPAPPDTHIVNAGFDFHVPVRFTKTVDEGLRVNVADFDAGTLPAIGVIEDKNSDVFSDEFFYGGSIEYTMTGDVTLAIASGRVVSVSPDTAGHTVFLPVSTGLPGGGPYFYIRNVATLANSVIIADSDNNAIGTALVGGDSTTILYMETGSNSGWWRF